MLNRRFSNSSINLAIMLVYLTIAILYRLLGFAHTSYSNYIQYAVSLFAIAALILVNRGGYNNIIIPPPEGAAGNQDLLQFLQGLRNTLLEEINQLHNTNQALKTDVSRLNVAIEKLRKDSNRSQLISFILGIVATYIINGIPNLFH